MCVTDDVAGSCSWIQRVQHFTEASSTAAVSPFLSLSAIFLWCFLLWSSGRQQFLVTLGKKNIIIITFQHVVTEVVWEENEPQRLPQDPFQAKKINNNNMAHDGRICPIKGLVKESAFLLAVQQITGDVPCFSTRKPDSIRGLHSTLKWRQSSSLPTRRFQICSFSSKKEINFCECEPRYRGKLMSLRVMKPS